MTAVVGSFILLVDILSLIGIWQTKFGFCGKFSLDELEYWAVARTMRFEKPFQSVEIIPELRLCEHVPKKGTIDASLKRVCCFRVGCEQIHCVEYLLALSGARVPYLCPPRG